MRINGVFARFVPCIALMCAVTSIAHGADVLTHEQFEARHSAEAVDGFNFKIDGGYFATEFSDADLDAAEFSGAHGYLLEAAVSLPLGTAFGLQVDAGVLDASIDGVNGQEDFGFEAHGIGAHVFWRDPAIGLIGLYGHQSEYTFDNGAEDFIVNRRYGLEAEGYLGDFTIKGFAGQDELDWNTASEAETFVTGKAEIDFYFTDNLMAYAGIEHSFEQTTAKIGVEGILNFDGNSRKTATAFYADVQFGVDTQTITGGIRVYAGPSPKSLKQRHREDDPATDLFGNFGAIGSCMNSALDVELASGSGPYPSKVLGPGIFTLPPGMSGMEKGIEMDGCTGKIPGLP